jgi:2-polyprenyl-3-methyl-5-hydroxy-6-metoxy-1,4-benzoquinol methylase
MQLSTDQVKEFFDTPFYLDHGRPIIQVRSMIVTELLGPINHARILDLGCGDGSLSTPFIEDAGALTLVDLSARMLELASNRIPPQHLGKVDYFNGPLGEFIPEAAYDIVIMVGVLAHVPSIDGAIEKLSQCLTPGGRAVVEFTPNPNPLGKLLFPYYWLRRTLSGTPMGYLTNKIPLAQLLLVAEQHGLTMLRMKRHYFPLPTMAMWPPSWFSKYTMFAMKNRFMSRIGTEHIMLFSKTS